MAVVSDARNERNVLILTGVGHFTAHFFELMFPTLAVTLAAQSGAPLEQVLGWSFLGYLLFGLGALPAGLLADRIGARLMLIAAIFGLGVAALAASEAPNGRALSLCLAVMGLFASVYHPAGTSLITRTIGARGRALGVNGMFGNVAIAVTPVVTAALVARLGWQDTYRMIGYVTCAIAVACAFLPIDERPTARAVEPVGPPWARRSMVLFGVLLVAAMLAGVSYRGNTLLLPSYFAARVPEIGFGLATSLVYLLGIGGQYVGGRLADRHDLSRLYLVFHALSLPALLLMVVLSGVPLLGGAAIFVFFSLGMQPIENSLFAQLTPPRWRATAFGIKFACTFGVGSLAVWLVQWADVTGGLRLALLCLAGVVALVVAVAAVFMRMSHRSLAPDTAAARRAAGADKAPLVEVGA
ncbi:MAG: MFS transporter [Candidatus Binatia bacterium]